MTWSRNSAGKAISFRYTLKGATRGWNPTWRDPMPLLDWYVMLELQGVDALENGKTVTLVHGRISLCLCYAWQIPYDRMYAQIAQCLVVAVYEDLSGDTFRADLVAVPRKA